MIAVLKFDLSDQDDKDSHRRAINADDCYSILYDISNEVRNVTKYGKDANEAIEKINNLLMEVDWSCYE